MLVRITAKYSFKTVSFVAFKRWSLRIQAICIGANEGSHSLRWMCIGYPSVKRGDWNIVKSGSHLCQNHLIERLHSRGMMEILVPSIVAIEWDMLWSELEHINDLIKSLQSSCKLCNAKCTCQWLRQVTTLKLNKFGLFTYKVWNWFIYSIVKQMLYWKVKDCFLHQLLLRFKYDSCGNH